MVDEVDKPFNYGKLYNLFKGGKNWIQGHAKQFKIDEGDCYCLSMGLYIVYSEEREYIAAYNKLIEAIRKMFPDRTSPLRTKIKSADEPMRDIRQYSLTSFNDNANTKFEDVMAVIIEAQV